MAIIFVLLYGACFIGLWFLLRVILRTLLKDKYKPSHLTICYLIMLPVAVVALGFLAILLIPDNMPG